ncbi:restriction endonuclease subunit S [Pseudoalteromonas sp. S4741]|uniref:restriction endonuclease subunit S n=1 Tax=Pseudoalteromonas sp. S4741 TaxID=579563 RepID=UPI00110B2D2C|nr:restriction endonuclease subunit S [Pseudoalteromonas sp. S4741]TMO23026.1 restriction endonuclease subunit S [Pseudoalteromonas sp. S4741]
MSVNEQIVPEGFKHTDIGLIPKDWTFSALRDVLKESPKYGINAAAIPLQGSLPVYIRITDISEDGYFSPSEKVGVNSPFSELYKLSAGDIVLARTGASVGKSYLYRERDGELVYAGFLIKVAPKNDLLNPEFLFQYLRTEQYWAWVTVNSMRSGQPGINGNEYGSLLVPLPKIKEQTAIANALSDVDALLTELAKLIAKKQATKTATMQQLLTGKTRLPQFATYTEGEKQGQPKGTKPSELGETPEDWDVDLLKDISSMRGRIGWQGLKQEEFTFNDQQPFLITGMNFKDGKIRWNEVYHIPEDRYEMDRNIQLKVGDILMTKDGTIGKLLFVDHIPKPHKATLNSHLLLFRPKLESYVPKYLYYLMKTRLLDDHIELHKSGSTFFGITQEAMGKLLVPLPSNEEQTAIANILSDMDNEIQTLEQRLAKTRQIKQGMMQQLLTGRTRLPFKKLETEQDGGS